MINTLGILLLTYHFYGLQITALVFLVGGIANVFLALLK